MRKFVTGALLIALLVGLDQWVKFLVETRLPFQQPVPVLPVLSWFRTWNEGIAFSLLAGLDDRLLTAITGAIILFVLWLWRNSENGRILVPVGFALIIGGALGNLIDRLFLGHVVDFILVHHGTWSFAVFNLADAFISIGAAAILLDEFLLWRSGRSAVDRNNASNGDRSGS